MMRRAKPSMRSSPSGGGRRRDGAPERPTSSRSFSIERAICVRTSFMHGSPRRTKAFVGTPQASWRQRVE